MEKSAIEKLLLWAGPWTVKIDCLKALLIDYVTARFLSELSPLFYRLQMAAVVANAEQRVASASEEEINMILNGRDSTIS